MTANRSLDEFAVDADGSSDAVGDAAEPDADVPVEAASDGQTARGEAAGDDAVEPLASTYLWTPDGAPCATCGEPAQERWRGDDGLVCLDCKEW